MGLPESDQEVYDKGYVRSAFVGGTGRCKRPMEVIVRDWFQSTHYMSVRILYAQLCNIHCAKGEMHDASLTLISHICLLWQMNQERK